MHVTLRAALLGSLAFGLSGAAESWAQQPRQPDGAPAVSLPGPTRQDSTARTDRGEARDRSNLVEASALESGSNSFTEGQARARLEDAGFTDVQDLRLDDAGLWRGRATQGGTTADVAMDFRGRIASGPGLANLGRRDAERTGTTAQSDRAQSGARPDGTQGNPPSTMTGRAVDRMQGEAPRPDGTPGNPPGTAVGRALDGATGSNATGANPSVPATSGGGITR